MKYTLLTAIYAFTVSTLYAQNDSMTWTNPPKHFTDDGKSVVITTENSASLWGDSHLWGYDYPDVHFYFRTTGNKFQVKSCVVNTLKNNGDEAGLMLKWERNNWIKLCLAKKDTQLIISSSFKNISLWPDWQILPLPASTVKVYFLIKNEFTDIGLELYYSFDGTNYSLLRLIPDLIFPDNIQVGLMAGSPMGGSFQASMTSFVIEPPSGFFKGSIIHY